MDTTTARLPTLVKLMALQDATADGDECRSLKLFEKCGWTFPRIQCYRDSVGSDFVSGAKVSRFISTSLRTIIWPNSPMPLERGVNRVPRTTTMRLNEKKERKKRQASAGESLVPDYEPSLPTLLNFVTVSMLPRAVFS